METLSPYVSLGDIYRGGFDETKAQARRGDERAADAVSRQFEAYFLQQMLKSMRATSLEGSGAEGQDQTYRDLFDHQLTLRLAEGEGIGLRGFLRDAVANVQPGAPAITNWESKFTRTAPEALLLTEGGAIPKSLDPSADPAVKRSEVAAGFDNPENYIQSLWPHAVAASRSLGVEPAVLIAQSALETGWGQHVMSHPDGRSSYNLFGIKADSTWDGEVVRMPTLEFEAGVIKKVRAGFRSYEDFRASFQDYVSFIQAQPRYADAVAQVKDPRAYMLELQKAGYATDPKYADKVLTLVRRVAPQLLATR